MKELNKKIKILSFETKEKASKKAAELIAKDISNKKKFTLGLATGETMIPIYKELVKLYKDKKINFQNVTTFNIDEYLNVEEERSFKFFLEKNFLKFVNVKKENQYFLGEGNFEKYEEEIKKVGGIDLCILGIGQNGHIAFNEPGSSFKSRARKAKLRDETRRVNKKDFKNLEEVPTEAVTIGIGTILEARKIIVLAFGKEKAQAVNESLNYKPRAQWPASALQLHKKTVFVLDKEAKFL